jgi:GTP cyclohydrolase II
MQRGGVRAMSRFSVQRTRRFMNFLSPIHAQPSAHAEPPARPGSTVRHAIMDARAGVPVLIEGASTRHKLVALPAETATPAGLAAFHAAGHGEPRLVLAASRAASLLDQRTPAHAGPMAWRATPAMLTPETLRAFADPTQPQPDPAVIAALHACEPGDLAAASLTLAKLGHLLPAMLIASAAPSADTGSFAVAPAADIAAYQADSVSSLRRVAEAALPLAEAEDARLIAYRPADGGPEHVALLIGRPEEVAINANAPLVRVHSECFTGDLLGSLRCDCGPQLHQAIRRMEAEGSGVLLYMAQEGRGIGLANKLRAYALQDRGLDTLDANRALGWGADERSFAAAAAMLQDLGITRIRLLTNNPDKVGALEAAGITIAGRLRHAIAANGVNDSYLETKARRFGHLLG